MPNEKIPMLWFDKRGCGPSELLFELNPFPAENEGRIKATLGLRIRAAPGGFQYEEKLPDSGFLLAREQVVELAAQMAQWLLENPT